MFRAPSTLPSGSYILHIMPREWNAVTETSSAFTGLKQSTSSVSGRQKRMHVHPLITQLAIEWALRCRPHHLGSCSWEGMRSCMCVCALHVLVVVSIWGTAGPEFRQCHQTSAHCHPPCGRVNTRYVDRASCLTAHTMHSLAGKTKKLTYCVETRRSKGKRGLAVTGRERGVLGQCLHGSRRSSVIPAEVRG